MVFVLYKVGVWWKWIQHCTTWALPKPDDKESQLDLPEDLKLDDAEVGADEDAENTAADDIEGDLHVLHTNWLGKLDLILGLWVSAVCT